MARVPPRLPDRPTIRVVQPCGALTHHIDALTAGLTRLEGAGCEVRWDPSSAARSDQGYLCGTDSERLDELVGAFLEPGVDAVWMARGGSGLARIAEAAVRALADAEPRVFVGFSDGTTLLDGLAALSGWVTFHGPVVTSLGRPEIAFDLERGLAFLSGEQNAGGLSSEHDTSCTGTLMGGNLSVLAAAAGTSLWPALPDAVWVLEDVAEPPYRIDRMLTQLRLAGLFTDAAAIWLGNLDLPLLDDAQVRARIEEDFPELTVLHGAPAGHSGTLELLPIGCTVEVGPMGWRPAEAWIG
jgi:muramoyltetrapeptide carboxypeptidase